MPDRSLARVAAVAWREFRYTALTKSFLFGAVALPIVMLGLLALLPPLLVFFGLPPVTFARPPLF